MDDFATLVGVLLERDVRFVVIGVWGANFFASTAGVVFTTHDRDLFVPPDAANLMSAWDACEEAGFELWSGDEPLDTPHDRFIADAVVRRLALTRDARRSADRHHARDGRVRIRARLERTASLHR